MTKKTEKQKQEILDVLKKHKPDGNCDILLQEINEGIFRFGYQGICDEKKYLSTAVITSLEIQLQRFGIDEFADLLAADLVRLMAKQKELVMSDIKMSDAFELPLMREASLGCVGFVTDDKCNAVATFEGVSNTKRNNAASLAVHAINNHDRLTQEVERLKTQNDKLIEALSDAADTLSYAANYCDVAVKERDIESIRELLVEVQNEK